MTDRARRGARDEGLGSWIRRRAASAPSDTALVCGDLLLSYAELADRIERLAGLLRRRGVRFGDRIAYQGTHHPLALESLFATATLGAVWVPVLPGRPADEVEHILGDAGVRLALHAGDEDVSLPCPTIDADEVDAELRSTEPDPSGRTDVALGDLAILGYTSGTTGRPKGTLLTHANLTWNAVHMLSSCRVGADDVTLALAPLTRLGGLGVLVLPTLFAGGTVVVPERTDASTVLESIERHAVTLLFANPAALADLLAHPGWAAADLSTLRTAFVGGNVVSEPLLHAYLDRGVPLRHGYGLTEASPVVTFLSEADTHRKFGSVGKPIGLVDLAIEGPDGELHGAGATGEIVIRGPNVTSGYWKRPDATAAASRDGGWWRTGDAGRLDEEGFLFVLDRMREAIRIGEDTIFPAQVESVLAGHPEVEDAAAVGGEDGLALFVVPRRRETFDEDAVWRRLREELPAAHVPSRLLTVGRVPRNAAAKIRRDELRSALGERAEPGPKQ